MDRGTGRVGFGAVGSGTGTGWTHWVLILGLLLTPTVGAEETPPAPTAGLTVVESTPFEIGQRVVLRSEILDTQVTMNVYVPSSFEVSSEAHTYPVLFAAGEHGNQFFTALVGLAKHLGDRERMPECLVVSLVDMGVIPEIHTHGMWGRETLGGGDSDPELDQRHLVEEVFPYLEENFRANDYRMLMGVSGSSLFPIYTFTQSPELFRSQIWIAAADTIGMGFDPESTFIDTFEALFAARPKLRTKIYLGVADRDLENRPEYQANLDQMETRLGRLPGLDLRVEIFPREDHYAVLLPAMLSAFEQNFPHQRWKARYRDLVAQPGDALANIDRYYEELSQEYGFTILPRADRWNNVNSLRFMIRHLVQLERTKEAVAVAQRRVEYRPRQVASFEGLADAYQADGQLGAVVEALGQGIELARSRGEETGALEERLATARQQLADAASTADPEEPDTP